MPRPYDEEPGSTSTIGRSFGRRYGMGGRLGDVAQDASAAWQELDQEAGSSMPVPAREDAPAPAPGPSAGPDDGGGQGGYQPPAPQLPRVRPMAAQYQVPPPSPMPTAVVVDSQGNDLPDDLGLPPPVPYDGDQDDSGGVKMVLAGVAGFGLGWLIRSLLDRERD